MLYTVYLAYQGTFDSEAVYSNQPATMEFLGMLNSVLFMLLGSAVGCPIASASGNVAFCPFISIASLYLLNLFTLV